MSVTHNRRYGNAETSIKSIKKSRDILIPFKRFVLIQIEKLEQFAEIKGLIIWNTFTIHFLAVLRLTVNTIKTFLYWHMKHDGSCVSLFLEYLCQTYVSRVTVEQNKSELFWLEGPWFPDIDLPVPFYTT